jgi:eukaryotic-like serine/threonine-protein kinase
MGEDKMIGRTVGHYRILARLGRGGMGVVYKAEDTRLGRTVALKLLPPELTRDAEAHRRFEREARAASLLDHPNICTIHDFGETEDDGQMYIAMAYYEGESLAERITRGPPLSLDEAIRVLEQMCRGLGKAHASGVIHRDVKPANVMLTPEGLVKVVDFGLAKLLAGSQLTKSHTSLGTAAYMAPEQLRGEEVGAQADIWSSGIVLFELLTGTRPFRGEYSEALSYSILNEQPATITELRPDLPVEIDRIIKKMLRKDPLQRYACTDDVIAELGVLRAPSSGSPTSGPRLARLREPLRAGAKLGPYEIIEPLGSGGMSDVYRARDTRLDRQVALKVLAPEFSEDAERKQRFQREAKAISSLSHPNICTLFDVGEQEGVDYLVMEYLEGKTLAEMKGGLPISQVLKIGIQIAEGLATAHRQGIVHRDLKPGNVIITTSGPVKLLDFGLAKEVGAIAMKTRGSDEKPLTAEGTIVGTLPYMAPEQIEGTQIDARTDIFALGTMLYEMVTGKRAFEGKTRASLIVAIIDHDPLPIITLQPGELPLLVHLINKCLKKDPDNRWQSARDIATELQWIEEGGRAALDAGARSDLEAAMAVEESRRDASRMTRRAAIAAIGGAVVGVAGTGAFVMSRSPRVSPRSLTRFAIEMPEGEYHRTSFADRLAMAPDGTSIVFNTLDAGGAIKLYMHALGELESKRVEEVTGGASAFFAPDGKSIGFQSRGTMRTMAMGGGTPVTLCAVISFAGATWADDDTIYFIPEVPGGLMAVAAAGGKPRQVASIDAARGERVLKFPEALPGGKALLVTRATADSETFDDAQIVAISTETGQRTLLVERGTHPRYSATGHIVFARNGELLAVRFDADRLVVSGKPVAVLDGVLMSRNTGAANFALAANGDLAYIPGIAEGGARRLAWVDRSGKEDPLPLPPGSYLHPRLSPDSRQLAVEIEGSNHDIFLYDFESGVLSNLTTDGVSHWPVWSPEGANIGYRSGTMGRFGLWQVPADRSQSPLRLAVAGTSQNAESYSPDGRQLAYTVTEPGSAPRIAVVPLQGEPTPRPLDSGTYMQGSAKFSPDGRWLAYCSMESGRPQVYVQAFPGPGAKIQVSADGGTDPVWRRSGEELFYRNADRMMVVPVAIGERVTAGRPQELWKGDYSHGMGSSCGMPGATSSNYEVTSDGQRFLMIKDDKHSFISRRIVVVQGWGEELRRMTRG